MSILAEAERLIAAGRKEDAVAFVEQSANQGDAEALFVVGNWRLFGLFGARNLEAAHRLFDQSVAKGYVEAIKTKAILTANGTGLAADAAAAEALLARIRVQDPLVAQQLDFLHHMPPNTDFAPDRRKSLCEAPIIDFYPGLLNERECHYLTAMAQPHLRPSFVTNPATGSQMPHPVRNSSGMNFGPTQEDLVIRRINERIATVSGTDVDCGEPLHILHYTPGQQYKPHTDGMPGEKNQRVWTVLIYLNGAYEGGATRFPKIDIDYRGSTGDGLIFHNVDTRGQPDPDTLHAGLPVTDGVKWLATRWIRERPYHPGLT